ncbi:MAG TPA: hypothetical protein VHL79_03055 [Ramlibacter sp.]|nr:hypothetical protein [Ramlibacter sp.]
MEDLPVLDAAALRQLAERSPAAACPRCAAIKAPGWEAMPGAFDRGGLRQVGTLRRPDIEDPTLQEHHPEGTNAWSPDAPVAPAFFPYNRCDAWQCVQCGRSFLRYTEYGGYYVEERVRELHAPLIVDAGGPP